MKKYKYSIGMFLCSLIAIAQDCPPDRIVTDPIDETGLIIQATNTITASNTIQSDASATYKAGDDISFIPGFDAVSGAALDALIEVCVSGITIPNDTLFHLQWGHHNIGEVPVYAEGIPIDDRTLGGVLDADADILEAWEITTGSPDITVALLDSGIDIGHPDLYHPNPDSLRIVEGYNFLENTTNTEDTFGHGTLVAGILGAIANNNIGIAGVDQQCKIMPLKVVDDSGSNIDQNNIVEAVQYAIANQANIISMSFGWSSELSHDLKKAMQEAIDADVLLLAAAGNDNQNGMDYPARYASIVGVGAMSPCNTRKRSIDDPEGVSCDNDDRNDRGLWGSNYGEGLDFVAPGVLLPSTDVLGPTGYSDNNDNGVLQYQSIENGDYILDTFGTSMSSPFAAGVAALVWAANPDLKNYQVRYILQQTVTDIEIPGFDSKTGYGSINARAAVEMAQTFDPNSDFLLPNLTLELVGIPAVVNSGQDIAITYRVINIGDAPAESTSTLTYYPTKIPSDNLAGVIVDTVIPALKPGALFENIAIIPIASLDCDNTDFSIRNYAIDFDVDVHNEVEEYNEFNHFKEKVLQPDLTIENVSLTPSKGGNYSLIYNIRNVGVGKAYYSRSAPNPFYRYEYYISEDAVLDPLTDNLLNFKSSIGFGLCSQNSISKQIELDIPDSANYLLIKVDGTEVINESNEANNVYAINLMPAIDPIEDPIAYAKAANIGYTEEHTEESIHLSEPIVFPNPFEEIVSFRFYTQPNAKVVLTVYDVEGKLQLENQMEYSREGEQLVEVDLSILPSGMYLYKLFVDGKPFSGKIIKK